MFSHGGGVAVNHPRLLRSETTETTYLGHELKVFDKKKLKPCLLPGFNRSYHYMLREIQQKSTKRGWPEKILGFEKTLD